MRNFEAPTNSPMHLFMQQVFIQDLPRARDSQAWSQVSEVIKTHWPLPSSGLYYRVICLKEPEIYNKNSKKCHEIKTKTSLLQKKTNRWG